MSIRTGKHDIVESGKRVKASLNDLITGTEELLRSTAAHGGAEVESVRDRLKRQLDSARELAREGERSAVQRYHQVSSAADGYVHENAWKTVGIAVVVGVMIGACLMSDHWRDR